MATNQANINRTGVDRYTRLKALQLHPLRSKGGDAVASAEDRAEQMPSFGSPTIPVGAERLASLLGATTKRNLYGEHLSLQCWRGECAAQIPARSALHLLLPNAPDEVLNPEQWLFLDTETTGLSGGTGTYPFLVGLAWWERGGLQIEQLFMRDFADECSLLTALAERIAERAVLVTFNGKSFDWPLLETRYRMTRVVRAPSPRAHLDFLHPARNLWRLQLGSVRLSELERHVLGWERGSDLPSEQIPRIYLEFLRGGEADRLVPVFRHNQMDLRGLAGLANRILSFLGDENAIRPNALELFGLSRMCERRGQLKRARKMYEQSILSALPRNEDRAARAALARLAKRDGDLARACELWQGVLGTSREGYEAYEQLAIHYEHQLRDIPQALAITREALARLRRARQLGTVPVGTYKNAKTRFELRRARLERKSRRAGNLSLMLGAAGTAS